MSPKATRSNRLITEYFPSVSRPRRRVTAKELADEQESLKRFFVSTNTDPPHFLVQEIKTKGRGVLTMCPIAKGHFICEYAGDLVTMKEARVRKLELC